MHVNYKKYNNIIYPNLICTFSRHKYHCIFCISFRSEAKTIFWKFIIINYIQLLGYCLLDKSIQHRWNSQQLVPPFDFGISTLLTGISLYSPLRISSLILDQFILRNCLNSPIPLFEVVENFLCTLCLYSSSTLFLTLNPKYLVFCNLWLFCETLKFRNFLKVQFFIRYCD